MRRFELQNWLINGECDLRFEMGMTGSFFEPDPYKFGKLDILERCSNNISTYHFLNIIIATKS